MPEPSEVERDMPFIEAVIAERDRLAARLKEMDRVARQRQAWSEESLLRAERAEAQLRMAREGLEQIAMPLDSIQPGWDVEDAEVDRAAMQRIARDTLARLDTPEQAASGSGGEGA